MYLVYLYYKSYIQVEFMENTFISKYRHSKFSLQLTYLSYTILTVPCIF